MHYCENQYESWIILLFRKKPATLVMTCCK
jgi:hypothetical protein